jgi:DNA-directed RNA polymerase specialized sigma24 family protein
MDAAKQFTSSELRAAWHRLTELEKGVVSQHRREGKTFRLIAEQTGHTLSNISNAWYRAVRKIREK